MNDSKHDAPGLGADWLNGWLAAIGITILLPEAQLAWTSGALPVAIISFAGDLPEALSAALPSLEDINKLSIARKHPNAAYTLDRTVAIEVFRERAALTRMHPDLSLACTITDLAIGDKQGLAHGPFDLPAPKGATIHDRLEILRRALDGDGLVADVRRSLDGHGSRIPLNGLGFDHRRFPAGANSDTQPFVDPVIELLAFAGMGLFPVRGTGTGTNEQQRGWSKPRSRRWAFTWPVWLGPLDRWAIDALLDRFWLLDTCRTVPRGTPSRRLSQDRAASRRLGVTGAFASVYREPKGANDVARGYASERVW